MKFTAFALAGVAAATDSELSVKYLNYLMKHNKSYSSYKEYMKRLDFFAGAEAIINAHNETDASYTMGHNKFSDMNAEERKQFRGRFSSRPETIKVREHQMTGSTPDSVDWRDQGAVSPVKDQGQCGSCWTFSTTGAMESAVAIATGTMTLFSEQQLVDCVTADAGCGGGLQIDAFAYLTQNYCILEDDYPYTATGRGTGKDCQYHDHPKTRYHTSGDGYVQVQSRNVEAMKNAVAITPLAVAVDAAGIGFSLYSGGIYDNANCGIQLDHATLVVGYGSEGGQEYWIMKNSWGESWGESGYMRLAITGDDFGTCGIQRDTQYPVLDM